MQRSIALSLLLCLFATACTTSDPAPTRSPTPSGGKRDEGGGVVAPGCRFAELHRGEALVGWETELIGPVHADDLVDPEAEQLVRGVSLATSADALASLDEALAAVDAGEIMLARLRYATDGGDDPRHYIAFQFLVEDVMQFVYFRTGELEPVAQVVDDTFVSCDEPL